MPWRETSPMEQRLEFVREYESGMFTMTELAAEYGIRRETGYTWVRRYEVEGPAGLHDRSRRPHQSANATPQWGDRWLLDVVLRPPLRLRRPSGCGAVGDAAHAL